MFYNWRFDDNQKPRSDFILNDSRYIDSKILLAGDNFGCGSSREHAVWALQDYGFDVVIAPSFADIFYSNCFKNGILPITLDKSILDMLFDSKCIMTVDLEHQSITLDSEKISFDIDSYKKKILMQGLDDIALTLEYSDEISEFEKNSTVPSVL